MKIELRRGSDGRHELVVIGWRESDATYRRCASIELELLRRLGSASFDRTQGDASVIRHVLDDADWTSRDIARIEGVLRGFGMTLERNGVPADEGRCAACGGEGETRASHLDEWRRCAACGGSGRRKA